MKATERRTCQNCACFARMRPDGSITDDETAQPVCRRTPPGGRLARVEVPVIHNGEPVLDKFQRPRMEAREVLQIGYSPTAPDAVCYDGWRPLGTAPGARWELDVMMADFEPMFAQLMGMTGLHPAKKDAN